MVQPVLCNESTWPIPIAAGIMFYSIKTPEEADIDEETLILRANAAADVAYFGNLN